MRAGFAVALLALAGCASGPFEWRAQADVPGAARSGLAGLAAVAAQPEPTKMSNFLLRQQEPFVGVSESQGNRFFRVVGEYATTAGLQKRAAAAVGAPAQAGGYPRLLVRLSETVLRLRGDGVAFTLRAEAQGAPGADLAWPASTHSVDTPTRTPEQWFAEDSELLRGDIAKALELLAASIGDTYRAR